LSKFVKNPFTENAYFDYETYKKVISIFTRMLDNVVEDANLPLKEQQEEIERKRRHGMGYLGLGSTMVMLGIEYGSRESLEFTDQVTKVLVLEGWLAGVELAKEKGCAPIFNEWIDPIKLGDTKNKDCISTRELFCNSLYMQRIFKELPKLKNEIL